ncbi:hypothetical protein BIW11_07719 [Tropilaelaps mercedesae]|uniref:LIM zinc-binding domain-containing protein n=1 Tax=Tropilaelaps mercedesae TaxID=418985 RepID=A0A1V9XT45_9ACAR|nr:hypothetical protein BIW11_07719 [Tropilaelaps mercedesae]
MVANPSLVNRVACNGDIQPTALSTNNEGFTWHIDHFCCCDCKYPLLDKTYSCLPPDDESEFPQRTCHGYCDAGEHRRRYREKHSSECSSLFLSRYRETSRQQIGFPTLAYCVAFVAECADGIVDTHGFVSVIELLFDLYS